MLYFNWGFAHIFVICIDSVGFVATAHRRVIQAMAPKATAPPRARFMLAEEAPLAFISYSLAARKSSHAYELC